MAGWNLVFAPNKERIASEKEQGETREDDSRVQIGKLYYYLLVIIIICGS